MQSALVLLANGADPAHVPYFNGKPSLAVAEGSGYHDIARLIRYLEKPDADFRSRLSRLGGSLAAAHELNRQAARGHTDEVRALLASGVGVDSRDEFSFTPLQNAALRLEVETVQVLVASGADVNARNAFDQTALMLVARGLAASKTLAPEKTNESPAKKIVDALLAARADKGLCDFAGLTALDYFLRTGESAKADNKKQSAKILAGLLTP